VQALAKVNRTDVALRMLLATEYPSYGYNIVVNEEHATSLWESWDGSSMQQWFDESSRDHHFSASINTFLRKYLGGLDQPYGKSGWDVIRVRPEAAHHPELLDSASVELRSRRGTIHCAWRAKRSVPPPPPPPIPPPLPTLCAASPQFPVPAGGLCQPGPLNLSCATGQHVSRVSYAKWGHPDLDHPAPAQRPLRGHGYYCFGPQPPPPGQCEADVSQRIEALCVGKPWCDLAPHANGALGDPCHLGENAGAPMPAGGYQLIARIECGGQPKAEEEFKREAIVAKDEKLRAEVTATIPPGSTGEIHVPAPPGATITEGGAVVWRGGAFVRGRSGLSGASVQGAFVAFETLSGSYSFVSS